MTNPVRSSFRARRLRSALLASAFAAGIAGAAGAGLVLGETPAAVAEPVRVEAPAPADFTTVVEKVKAAVVSVQVKAEMQPAVDGMDGMHGQFPDLPPDHPFNEFFRRFGPGPGPGQPQPFEGPRGPRSGMSQGSGFFISQDGYVVTNNHVVREGKEFRVVTDDGQELDAKLIGTDERTDLALLKVEGNDFAYAPFAKEEPKIGQWAIAVGNPFGLGGTVTAGIVSALGRDIGAGPYDDFIQIDAPVNRGNSGGPTFNAKGEVIGVNAAIFSPSGGNVGIAFAIPAATVEQVVAQLKSGGKVTRGWLGVQIQPVTKDIAESLGIEVTKGALVAEPQADGPAAAAGLKAGDIIVKVDGKEIEGPRELARIIAGYAPDTTVTVSLLRDGKPQDLPVKLGELTQTASREGPASEPGAQPGSLDGLGLALAPNEGGKGVLVTGVDADGPAAEKGLQPGDVIVSVGGRPVDSLDAVKAGLAAAQEQGRKAVLLQVEGERGTRFVALPIELG